MIGTSQASYGRGNLKVCRRGKKGSILQVDLSRPHVMNAFNDDVYEDLIDLMRDSAKDSSVSALVLTGTGDFFSSGADLKSGAFTPEPNGRQTLHKPAGRFMMAIIAYPKILAAAVQGPAIGIAVTLLMHCDLVHCTPKATFWAPFTRLALVPELCSSHTFMESMGLSKANELLLLGKKIDATTALNWNICSQIVRDADTSGDPFHPQSLASQMCQELDKRLLSLPNGDKTAQYFSTMIKGSHRKRMEQVCREELLKLDERFDTGQVQQAAKKLRIGGSRTGPRSKL